LDKDNNIIFGVTKGKVVLGDGKIIEFENGKGDLNVGWSIFFNLMNNYVFILYYIIYIIRDIFILAI